MLTVYILLLALFLAGAALFHAASAVWHAGLWAFGGFALLNVLYVLFWVLVASTVDDKKPLEKPRPLCCLGCKSIPRWLCLLFGVCSKLTGEEKLPEQGRFVLVSNHRSGFDPLVTLAKLGKRGLAFITKPANLQIPFVGKLGYGGCCLPIDRENDRKALKTILTAADYIKKDFCSMGIYPEGTRTKTGELLPFHAGSFKLAQKAGVPLVIACISGTEKIMHNFPFRFTPVELQILEVMPSEKVKAMNTQELAAYSRNLIETALNGQTAEAAE